MPGDSLQQLGALLQDSRVHICFCPLCKHMREYGHCYSCRCQNNQPRPPSSEHEVTKMLATIEHWKRLAVYFLREQKKYRPDNTGGDLPIGTSYQNGEGFHNDAGRRRSSE